MKCPLGNFDFMNKIKANHLILPPSTPTLIIPLLGRRFYRGGQRGRRRGLLSICAKLVLM